MVVSDVVPVVGCDWIPIPGANSDSDPVDRSRIPIRRIPLGFLNPVIRCFPIGSLSNLMGFDRNPMGSDRFRSDPIVGLIDLGNKPFKVNDLRLENEYLSEKPECKRDFFA